MANSVAEAVIGAVVLAAAAGFVLYAGQSRGVQVGAGSYPLNASFRSVEGITVGTDVRLAGITVGTVTGLDLDGAPGGRPPERDPEGVAERVGGVGGHHEGLDALAGGPHRGGRGGGGLADPTLAGEEDDAHGCVTGRCRLSPRRAS